MGRRALSIGLSGVLVVGVGAALVLGGRESNSEPDAGRLTVVRGVVGSEKAPFFRDAAVMYLAITSHIANGDQVVQDEAQEQAVLPEVTPLFMKQGFSAATSGPPFDDYVSQGVGHTPLLLIADLSEYLERRNRQAPSELESGP
jgi:hypothetical protein